MMLCGNKTDLCPVCQKYIRRAIFAYHYENNCAHPNEGPTQNLLAADNGKEKKNKLNFNTIKRFVHCQSM